MKKFIIALLLIIIIAGVGVGLYFATNKGKDWNPNNWGNNITGGASSGNVNIIKSEKYGDFDLTDSVFLSTGLSMIYIDTGTKLENIYKAYAKNIDTSEEYIFIQELSTYNDGEAIYNSITSPKTLYTGNYTSGLYGCVDYGNAPIEFDKKSLEENNVIPFIPLYNFGYCYTKNIDMEANGISVSPEYLHSSINIRIITKPVTYSGMTGNIPVVLTSTTGQVLTEDVYNEIKAEYASRGDKFPE